MLGDRFVWESFNLVYMKYLKMLQDSLYVYDEEIVIFYCYEECVELFYFINLE